MPKPRGLLHVYFGPRRHTALLVTLVVVISVRPLIGDTGAAPVVFSLALLVLLLVALLTIQIDELIGERQTLVAQRTRRNLVGWALAAAAGIERLLAIVSPTSKSMLVGTITWLLFLSFVTWSLLRNMLRRRTVTGETISNAVSVYLLMGFCWGLLYVTIFIHSPDAFHFGDLPPPDLRHAFPIFIYFSLTTLSTIGFGDITPVTLVARYAAVAEGITGQLYLAILVARLVGLQMAASAEPAARHKPSDAQQERVDR